MKAFILLISLFLSPGLYQNLHPYHIGSVEITYNEPAKEIEIVGKFFLDDLELALQNKYGKSVHFNDPKSIVEIDALLKLYIKEYLRLRVDNQFLALNYLGFEEEHESVNIYIQAAQIKTPKKMEASVGFLYNTFNDQINIIHMIIGETRKSQKLEYPERYISQTF